MKKYVGWKLNNGKKVDTFETLASNKNNFYRQLSWFVGVGGHYDGVDSVSHSGDFCWIVKENKVFTVQNVKKADLKDYNIIKLPCNATAYVKYDSGKKEKVNILGSHILHCELYNNANFDEINKYIVGEMYIFEE